MILIDFTNFILQKGILKISHLKSQILKLKHEVIVGHESFQ